MYSSFMDGKLVCLLMNDRPLILISLMILKSSLNNGLQQTIDNFDKKGKLI